MLTVGRSSALVALLLSFLILGAALVDASPQRGNGRNRGGNRGGNRGATRGGTRGGNRGGNANGNAGGNNNNAQPQTAQEQAAQIPGGISQATDGSTILDMTVDINNLPIRFKVSAAAADFTTLTDVTGATQDPNTPGTQGLNVLLHGDGGQSFFDFPNQGVLSNLAGVAVLAPDPNLFWGGGQGLDRTDGVAHAQAVNDLILDVLPQVLSFNSSNVFFTGVSGGALLMSGFFVPAHGANFAGNGVLLNCGALAPQVDVVDAATVGATTRIHFQSTQDELASLQQSIPEAIVAYEQIAADAGLSAAEVNALQTVDNTPNGGHCEFDGRDFVDGIQLIADNFATIMQGGDGEVNGIGNVLTGVVGNEQLVFAGGA
ncbi:uncharacterized protein DNG_03011 [Cephalotrichum gorgonifer]|uniref:Uncharacterized protein n=1 Tax=Cephalotrichum gorgonifer TaxID=2041049 RepID=A0AAE8MTG2_9PEZI|nr:uncharacterized protein DNG_03011 [Cephalotrichum gorgonifer]